MSFPALRRKSPARSASSAAPAGGDRLGLYPAERDVPTLEGRRYLWIARAFAIGMFLSLCLNVVLGLAIAALSPLVRVEPMLLTFKDRSEQIVRIEPFQRGSSGFELMTEMLVRDYVLSRHEVVLDESDMRRRWGGQGLVAHRSSPEEYARFVSETAPRFDAIRQARLVRSVEIHRVSKIAEGYWQVAFSTRDMVAGADRGGVENWVASLTIAYVPREVSWEDRYMNPLGFVVTDYAVVAER